MAKPSSSSSSSRLIARYLHHHIASNSKPSTSSNPTATGISHFISKTPKKTTQDPTFTQNLSPNYSRSRLFGSSGLFRNVDPHAKLLPNRDFMGLRYLSLKSYDKGSKNFAKKVMENPALAVRNTFVRYREAVGLQIEAFWKRNYLVILGAGGVVVCIVLWRVLFGIANTFINFSEGMAKYGFLALSSAIVAFTGLYFRSKFTINPDKVYRMAMRRLNTSAGILEVMGAPLTGTDLRAYVMSGGGISLKNFKPNLRSKRCFLIFPIQGSERKGLVSVEVKKNKGQVFFYAPAASFLLGIFVFQFSLSSEMLSVARVAYIYIDESYWWILAIQYDMKLLAVDIPMASGPDQRLFLIGDEEEYRVGGGLISELRDPVVTALAAAKEFEARDEKEDEEDAAREQEEAERKHREEISKLEKQDSQ